MSSDILPPRYPSPLPQIPPQSNPPKLELMLQEIGDDEPTLKMLVPPHLLHASRERDDSWQRSGPNWGLIFGLLFCLAFWGSIAYLVLR
jgi:hypothetical protein